MRNLNKYYLIVFILSFLPIISIFITSDMPHVHDGKVHLARMAAYFKALQDFQIPVRWAGDLNYGYGMPLFNFIYHLPYLLSSLFLFFGFGLVDAYKIVLTFSFLLSGVFMFAFAKEFFNDDRKAILVALFYQFAPFRLVELMVRGSFGEVYTYSFFPLVLFGLVKIFKKKEGFWIIFTAIATALLILSHNALSLTFFGTTVLFIFFFGTVKGNTLRGFFGLTLGLMLSSFYWIPAIAEHKYTYGDLFMKDLFRTHFPPLQNFFIPNLTNIENLQTGGIATQIGLFHEIALLLGAFSLIVRHSGTESSEAGRVRLLDRRGSSASKISNLSERFWTSSPRWSFGEAGQNDKKIIVFCLIVFFAALFFMQPISAFIWENISFLRQFQFSWRFLGVVVFVTSLLSVSFLNFKVFQKKLIFTFLIFLTVATTLYFWKPPLGFETIDEEYYWNYPLNTTYFGETDVIWSGGPATSYPKQRVEIISGKANIDNFKKKSNIQTFRVNANTNVQIVSHTQYFPGWNVYVDSERVNFEFQDPNHRGEITFWVPEGKHEVKVAFEETRTRLAADIVSLSTLGLVAGFFLWKKKKFL